MATRPSLRSRFALSPHRSVWTRTRSVGHVPRSTHRRSRHSRERDSRMTRKLLWSRTGAGNRHMYCHCRDEHEQHAHTSADLRETMNMADIPSPLHGLVVLDLTVDRPGSVAGMLLADLGADVNRVETTDGGHRRGDPYVDPDWICWDRGKRTVTVRALDPVADRSFRELLTAADVVLLDPTPGAAHGGPLAPRALSDAYPRLGVIWIPPYGASGERYQDLPSDPLLLSAISGFAMWQPAARSGGSDRSGRTDRPVRTGFARGVGRCRSRARARPQRPWTDRVDQWGGRDRQR